MKRLLLLMMLLMIFSAYLDAQADVIITMDETIVAGDSWHVSIKGGNHPEPIELALLVGLEQYTTQLVPDEKGEANWSFAENELLQSGTALLFVKAEGTVITRQLNILPQPTSNLDLFATGNAIEAYGIGTTQVIAFAHDIFGNPIHNQVISFFAQSPDGTETISNTTGTTYGRANVLLRSLGNPGRLRVSTDVNDTAYNLRILQFPSEPHNIQLEANEDCMLSDRRESIRLQAIVEDTFNYPVRDGTIVRFEWGDAFTLSPTLNGMATVFLPPISTEGTYELTARSGDAVGRFVLQIEDERCS